MVGDKQLQTRISGGNNVWRVGEAPTEPAQAELPIARHWTGDGD